MGFEIPLHTSILELAGFLTGAVSFIFGIRQWTITWPLNILSNVLLAMMFLSSERYLSAGFRVLMIGLALYGWHLWSKRRSNVIEVVPLQLSTGLILIGASILIMLGASSLSEVTFYRAGLTDTGAIVLTLGGQFLLARRHLESWYVFSASDVLSFVLYLELRFFMLAALAVLTFVMCLIGLRQWRIALAMPVSKGIG